MKKEITPATAIVIVLIVLAVIAGVYFVISKPKETGVPATPPPGVFPSAPGSSTGPGTAPAPPAPAPGQ
ncbi:MAG: hypothetical protein ACYC1M_05615 [Armatimonadota bacterium]